ncbi:MAG: GDSL-type esterase/lipase family protein [Thermodesulfobacteriota bacterium]
MKTVFACLLLPMLLVTPSFSQTTSPTGAAAVFLGDSMLYGFANFPEYIPGGVVNLAVTTSKSSGVVQTVNTAVQHNPRTIFIMTGINDIADGDLSGFTRNYNTILDTIAVKSPGSKVYVQALLPVNWTAFPRAYDFDNGAVNSYNSAISGVAASHANATYLDFRPYFTDASGNLKAELSKDGLHLNSDGYKIWGGLMSRYF